MRLVTEKPLKTFVLKRNWNSKTERKKQNKSQFMQKNKNEIEWNEMKTRPKCLQSKHVFGNALFCQQKCQIYLQTTFNFHVVSRNSPVTFGFSARHVIDLPSSSVDGTKLNSERLVVLAVSSYGKSKCTTKKKKKYL